MLLLLLPLPKNLLLRLQLSLVHHVGLLLLLLLLCAHPLLGAQLLLLPVRLGSPVLGVALVVNLRASQTELERLGKDGAPCI